MHLDALTSIKLRSCGPVKMCEFRKQFGIQSRYFHFSNFLLSISLLKLFYVKFTQFSHLLFMEIGLVHAKLLTCKVFVPQLFLNRQFFWGAQPQVAFII